MGSMSSMRAIRSMSRPIDGLATAPHKLPYAWQSALTSRIWSDLANRVTFLCLVVAMLSVFRLVNNVTGLDR